jgi:hypothetical protein
MGLTKVNIHQESERKMNKGNMFDSSLIIFIGDYLTHDDDDDDDDKRMLDISPIMMSINR